MGHKNCDAPVSSCLYQTRETGLWCFITCESGHIWVRWGGKDIGKSPCYNCPIFNGQN